MTSPADLDTLSTEEIKQLAGRLLVEMRNKQVLIDKLPHENAPLKRLKFAAASEAYSGEKQQLLFETIDTDLAALSAEIESLTPAPGQLYRRIASASLATCSITSIVSTRRSHLDAAT